MTSAILAKVNGSTIEALPPDLFIPPDALEVYLDSFEGPLDLLLYLIRKHNIDILHIPMAELTRQYMAYVDKMRAIKIELAADYLLMSAMLIEIKSRMLLPKPTLLEDEEADPRTELVKQLLAYEAFKRAGQNLESLPQVGLDIMVAQAHVESVHMVAPLQISIAALTEAWQDILKRASHFATHKLGKSELSVREHMAEILRRLRTRTNSESPEEQFANGQGMYHVMRFDQFFDVRRDGIAKLVVCFLAILELCREGLIEISQQAAGSPIYVGIRSSDRP